jgi:hypothetical protein
LARDRSVPIHYQKRLQKTEILCEVRVFSFRVDRQLDNWPERNERQTKWFEASAAAELVDEGGLAGIIGRFAGAAIGLVPIPTH